MNEPFLDQCIMSIYLFVFVPNVSIKAYRSAIAAKMSVKLHANE